MHAPAEVCRQEVEATNGPGEQPAGRWLGPDETLSAKVMLEVQAGNRLNR